MDYVESAFTKTNASNKSNATPEDKSPKPTSQTVTNEQTVSVTRQRSNAISEPKTDPKIQAAAENVRRNVSSGKETITPTKSTPTTAISASKKQDQNKGASR